MAGKPPLPREHGAWGILLIPLATALGVSGVFDLKVALLIVSVLGFYVARASLIQRHWRWAAVLLGLSAAAALPLLLAWRLWWLPVFGVAAAPLALRRTNRSLAWEIAAVAGLTLTAPAAWYVATGRLDATAGWLWLLNTLYFAGGVYYVRMHIAATIGRQPLTDWRPRITLGRVTLVVHLLAAGVVVALAVGDLVPSLAVAAFVPALLRAGAGIWRLSPRLRVKRLGWTEVAHSVVFALLLVVAWRLG